MPLSPGVSKIGGPGRRILRYPVPIPESAMFRNNNNCLDNGCCREYIGAMAATHSTVAKKKFDSTAQEAYLNLWRTYDRLRAFEDELFAKQGLTAQQYNALRLLREVAPDRLPTLVLAERLISRAPDITRLLDRLEERLLIDRVRPDGDRRTVMVGITPVGHHLLLELDDPVRKCHEQQLGHLKPAAMKQLISLLKAARKPHEKERSGS